ncbi:MAG TPA: TonB-dependent receptor plug domain-containing protein [Candidatus Sulfotelmatobacter sp.]
MKRHEAEVLRLLQSALCLLLASGTVSYIRADDAPADPQTERRLTQMNLEELGNTEVTTVSKEPVKVARTPAAIYVITHDDIQRSGATSIPEALRLAPGVEVARIDSVKWAVGIRGFGSRLSRSVLVLIDGRSVYSPLFHGVYWEVQDTLLEDVDRIEVIRGPGGTIWGANAVNGVINIITKNAKDTQGSFVSGGGGGVDQGLPDFRFGSGNDKNFSYRFYGKGLVRGAEFHPNGEQFDDWWRAQGGFRTDWDATNRDTLTVQGDLYDEDAGESVQITSESPPATTVVSSIAELSGGNLLGRWRRDLGNGSDFQLQTYYDRVNRQQANQAEFRDTFDVDFVHHLILPAGQDFLWGLGARASVGRVPLVVPTYVFTVNERTDQLYSAFAQGQIPLAEDRLWLTIGSKFVHSAFAGFDAEPTARLLWAPTARQSIWTAVTRAVRTPSDTDEDLQTTTLRSTNPLTFSRTLGNGEFISETLLGYEAGYRNLVTRKLAVDIAGFYNNYDHLSSLEPGTPFIETSPAPTHLVIPSVRGNGLLGHTSGFEITPEWRPTRWWRLASSYSYLRMDLTTRSSSLDTTTVSSTEGASPHHQVMLQSFTDLPGNLELNLSSRYISALSAQLVGSYGTADAQVAWHPIHHFSFSVLGQNLVQPHHSEFGTDPGTLIGIKRTFYANITWRSTGD